MDQPMTTAAEEAERKRLEALLAEIEASIRRELAAIARTNPVFARRLKEQYEHKTR